MKIGILTYHAPFNFGANLQAYASQNFFCSLGHDTWVINYVRESDINPQNCNPSQIEGHFNFSQNTLRVTKRINRNEIYSLVKKEKFDLIAIGADAVWNKRVREDLEVFYAKWLWGTDLENKVKVIALSPAFMGRTYSDLTEGEKKSFRDGLLKFSYIDTRDAWTRYIVNKEIVGYNYIKTLNPDPVFLLDEFCNVRWEIPSTQFFSKKYYILSLPKDFAHTHTKIKQMWFRRFKKIVNKHGYQLVELPIPEGVSGFKFDYTVPYPIDPLQWFLWLKNAKAFIGLRFHAVVSCISAGTPFFSLDIYGRNSSKINRILNLLGIHCFDNNVNRSSKIRNLLDGSGLESYRINGDLVYFISANKVFRKLEKADSSLILNYKEKMVSLFKSNMQDMLNAVKQ
ncbi:MAG: polysaccharide pyruvyl transferase family protein [Eubacteriales bacterium]|nr:polysaccharide pyruvyl transferase family protein [Eubacteriales bacterium]